MEILPRIIAWAQAKDSIRAILMVGSRAGGGKMDEFSDFDLSLFGHSFEFIGDDQWLETFAVPIICIHDQFDWGTIKIPTRLTIFEDFSKYDFSFHPYGLLESMARESILNPGYDAGYEVLLDKDGVCRNLPRPSFQSYQILLPDKKAFQVAINEFWFEAYHLTKYLARKDLWVAKSRDHAMKQWLLRMLQWNAKADSKKLLSAKNEGKQMNEWVRKKWQIKLVNCFAGWNQDAQWQALVSTTRTFSELSRETAVLLSYSYERKAESGILDFIKNQNPHSHGNGKIIPFSDY